ncbi:MAG: hypothetical protein WC663_04740 [Patescibacteria group bacterium]|jgi:hypothetical protein
MNKNKKNISTEGKEILRLRDLYNYLQKHPTDKENFYSRIQNMKKKLDILEKKLNVKGKIIISKKENKSLEAAIKAVKNKGFVDNKKEFAKFLYNWQLFLEMENRVNSLDK